MLREGSTDDDKTIFSKGNMSNMCTLRVQKTQSRSPKKGNKEGKENTSPLVTDRTRSMREGYVFTSICLFTAGWWWPTWTGGGGGGIPPWMADPPLRMAESPPIADRTWMAEPSFPLPAPPPHGQPAVGTHPTGMHSCVLYLTTFHNLDN